jgi:hypothetical protein
MNRTQRGSLMRLIVGDQEVSPTPSIPRLFRARISLPITRPIARIAVLFHVQPMLRACGNDVALPHATPWIALVPQLIPPPARYASVHGSFDGFTGTPHVHVIFLGHERCKWDMVQQFETH